LKKLSFGQLNNTKVDSESESFIGGDDSKSFKKDYNIDVQLKDNEKPSLILYKYRWVVLCSFFFTSCSTGALTGSLSTNRGIIDKLEESLDRD
jgi:hypothetical protein